MVRNTVEAAYMRSDVFERRCWAQYRPGGLPRYREPSAARTMIALSPPLAHQLQRPRNVAASVL